MRYDAYCFVMDFAFMSLLLFGAQFLRTKVRILQNFYIPSSVIAGILGLLLGPQALKIIPWSSEIGSYAYLLICVVFAGLYIGKKEKVGLRHIFKRVGDTFCMNMATEFICFGSALVLGGGIIKLFFPHVFTEFALLLPSGFCGGHGYAATIGTALNNLLGRDDCVQIGQTFATLGLLTGLIGGIILINYSIRKGYTSQITSAEKLPEEYRTGIVKQTDQKSIGKETINPVALDPLAWHLALILIATLAGYLFYNWYKQYLPDIEIPMMCLTMIAGVLLQKLIEHTPMKESVDKHVIDRIGSCVTDYLVAFGIASISINVVRTYILPILVLCIIGTVWPIIMVFFCGRRLFNNYWFERSIFIFGWCTGVVAIGVTLLRIVDPKMKTGTLDDYGTAYTLISVIEVFIVALTPQLTISLGWGLVGTVELLIGISLLFTCARFISIKSSDRRNQNGSNFDV